MGGQQSSNQSSAMEAGTEPPNEAQELNWWCRILIKLIAGIAGIIGFISGIFACIALSICVLAGILQMLISILLLVFELSFCFTFIEFTRPISTFADRRTFFQKAIIYGGSAIVPFAMCVSASTAVGCACIFATGVFYGLMALGKKADRSEMMARAGGGDQSSIVANDQLSQTAQQK